MGTINSSDRIAATLYSLGTLFVSGIYVQIPCIKEIVVMMIIIIITIFLFSFRCPTGKFIIEGFTKVITNVPTHYY
jgi:hypothetical protein